MNQPQYDMQAHSEQIRHQQIAAQDAAETAEELAAGEAFIALAEMPGYELSDMIANADCGSPMQIRLELLLERVAMLGMPANNDCYAQDVVRAAKSLHQAMLEVVTEKRVKAVRE